MFQLFAWYIVVLSIVICSVEECAFKTAQLYIAVLSLTYQLKASGVRYCCCCIQCYAKFKSENVFCFCSNRMKFN